MAADGNALELVHCPPGDPCERTAELRVDGTVRVSALCGEILPVLAALAGDVPEMVPADRPAPLDQAIVRAPRR
jgi:hypothetical protein